jgi:hypothetical protein
MIPRRRISLCVIFLGKSLKQKGKSRMNPEAILIQTIVEGESSVKAIRVAVNEPAQKTTANTTAMKGRSAE